MDKQIKISSFIHKITRVILSSMLLLSFVATVEATLIVGALCISIAIFVICVLNMLESYDLIK